MAKKPKAKQTTLPVVEAAELLSRAAKNLGHAVWLASLRPSRAQRRALAVFVRKACLAVADLSEEFEAIAGPRHTRRRAANRAA